MFIQWAYGGMSLPCKGCQARRSLLYTSDSFIIDGYKLCSKGPVHLNETVTKTFNRPIFHDSIPLVQFSNKTVCVSLF